MANECVLSSGSSRSLFVGRSRRWQYQYGVTTYGANFVNSEFPCDLALVGSNDEATSGWCGSWARGLSRGCLETHLHKPDFFDDSVYHSRSLDGRCLSNMAVIKPRAHHCSDPKCPLCCKFWAFKSVARALRRFEAFDALESSSGYVVVHVTVSVPKCDWQLGFLALRKKAVTVSMMVGLDGGLLIFHPKRYDKRLRLWYFSPHWHVLGVCLGGRVGGDTWIVNEKGDYEKVNGVKAVFDRSGYVVKNLGSRCGVEDRKRTLMYQLSHAGVPNGHTHAIAWFGCLSYNQLSVPKVHVEHEVCPFCNSDLRLVSPFVTNVDGEKVLDPVWNGHLPSIFSSQFEDRVCLVSPVGWHYVKLNSHSKIDCYGYGSSNGVDDHG